MAQEKKRKVKRNVEQGRIYIKATFTNTIMTITDAQGNAIGWSSTGSTVSRAPVRALHLQLELQLMMH